VKQAIVIGLGQFGMSLSRALTEEGVEVIAVDSRPGRVQEASAFVAQAMTFDATDEEALAGLAPGRRDIGVCAIGDEAREASIIVTALLRQLGTPRVVARASDDLHGRILSLVGAHEVINPERAFGERYARRLVHAGIIEEIPLGRALVVSEVKVRPVMVGRTLPDLTLHKHFGITVLGLQTIEDGKETLILPDPRRPLTEHDTLIVVGRPGAARKLHEEW